MIIYRKLNFDDRSFFGGKGGMLERFYLASGTSKSLFNFDEIKFRIDRMILIDRRKIYLISWLSFELIINKQVQLS